MSAVRSSRLADLLPPDFVYVPTPDIRLDRFLSPLLPELFASILPREDDPFLWPLRLESRPLELPDERLTEGSSALMLVVERLTGVS